MLQLENILFNNIYTFVFNKGMGSFEGVKFFTHHQKDISIFQFWACKLIS